MTSRSIVLGTAALLLMSAATPLQIGFSPTAAFAQQVSLEAALSGTPAELNAGQLRERIKLLRAAIDDGTLQGSDEQAARQKIKAYRDALDGMIADNRGGTQERQAEQPRQGERTQRQPDRNAEQRQAEQSQAERQSERQAEREAKREAQQQRKAEREADRQAEREAQREAQQQRKAEREAERQAQREAQREEQQSQAERQAERKAQRQAERQAERDAQREAEQRQAEQRQAEQQGQRQQRAQQDDGSGLTREMVEALRDNRPASELDQAELRNRLQALRAAMHSGALPNDQRRSVQARIVADREVALARRAERMEDTTPEQPQRRERRAESEDRPQQEVDRQAREIISDNRPASDLDINVLRERLTSNRELLGTDQLSGPERRQLREQLDEDREELRARVAARQEEQEEQEEARAPERSGSDDRTRGSRDRTRDSDDDTSGSRDRTRWSDDRLSARDVSRIIEERTPSDQLTDRELEQRVRVLSRALNRGNITVREGEVARLLIDRDREELRGRLYADRDRRRDRRRSRSRDDVFVEFEVGYRTPPVIYAAEAMPRDIQMQLVAPPMYQTQRAYSPQEIATNHEVRETMPGIEIDTLNFDFGSAEVRPEEIEKLDEIGVVIESIVAERPDEVFLIEGHTDAVGSDAANDALSQQRALAVVEALLDYFIIDPENLQTVGLGERYLRINTPEAEEENRRVTVRRITPLLAGG